MYTIIAALCRILPFNVWVFSLLDFFGKKFPTKASPSSVTMAMLLTLSATSVTVNCRLMAQRHRLRLGLAACQTNTYHQRKVCDFIHLYIYHNF